MKTNLKAYITIYNKKERKHENLVLSLEEAKARLTAKQYEKLISFEGIHTATITGYVK